MWKRRLTAEYLPIFNWDITETGSPFKIGTQGGSCNDKREAVIETTALSFPSTTKTTAAAEREQDSQFSLGENLNIH